jgi:hypothetical protein
VAMHNVQTHVAMRRPVGKAEDLPAGLFQFSCSRAGYMGMSSLIPDPFVIGSLSPEGLAYVSVPMIVRPLFSQRVMTGTCSRVDGDKRTHSTLARLFLDEWILACRQQRWHRKRRPSAGEDFRSAPIGLLPMRGCSGRIT